MPKVKSVLAEGPRQTRPEDLFMNTEQLTELALQDPEYAQRIMDLQDRLQARKIKEDRAASEAASQIMMLESHRKSMEELEQGQRACGAAFHRRPDGQVSISGQKLGDGSLFLICCRCMKNFYGIGDGPNQLSRAIANQVDWNNIGS